jgi:hypothetical protein
VIPILKLNMSAIRKGQGTPPPLLLHPPLLLPDGANCENDLLIIIRKKNQIPPYTITTDPPTAAAMLLPTTTKSGRNDPSILPTPCYPCFHQDLLLLSTTTITFLIKVKEALVMY